MRCPKCGCLEDKVIDSRSSKEGATIRRRRQCLSCQTRFTTYEEIEHRGLMVIKRDGRRETFSREKLFSGIERACQKRPVSRESMEAAMVRISTSLHDEYEAEGEVPGLVIGGKVMEELRSLDEVAYVRYASIYRRFEEAVDFVQAVKKLEVKHDTATFRLPGI